MFLYNKNIILNKQVKDNVFIREIYDYNLVIWNVNLLILFIMIIILKERLYNNTSFTIKDDSEIFSVSIDKNLPIIKYNYSKSDNALVSNPFIGTFDLETFEDNDGR